MALTPFLRYSHRVATKRTGGRYDLRELWQIPGITNTDGGTGLQTASWQNDALNAAGLPELGDVNQDGGYICTSIVPRSLDDQGTADVDVTYVEDPLTLATEVNYFGQSKQKPVWQAIAQLYGGPDDAPAPTSPPDGSEDDLFDDDSIRDTRNSAGDRYNPPLVYDFPLQRIEVVTRCSLSWYDSGISSGQQSSSTPFQGNWEDYKNHWNVSDYTVTQVDPDNPDNNSDKFFPAGTLMLIDVRAPLMKDPFYHRLLTCVFLYDPDMWCHRVPDMGPRALKYLATRSGSVVQVEPPGYPVARVAVTDTLGRPFGGAAELDGSGNQMIPGDDGTMPSANIWMFWPVDPDGNLLSAEFDDLDLYTPERVLKV